jgi:hypothetical protein
VASRVLPRWRTALAAGLFLGALQAVRIDATIMYVVVPPLLAVAWLVADARGDTRGIKSAEVAFVVGLGLGVALGLVDLVNHSGFYWHDLWHHEKRIFAVLGASVAASIVLVVLWRFVLPLVRRWRWSTISNVAAIVVVVLGLGMWIARPHLQHTHGKAIDSSAPIQVAEHAHVDPSARYFERSMDWMQWYLGPLTLCASILGAALLVRALLRGRLLRTLGLLALFVPTSVLYLWRASAAPDHVWVTRRFLVTTFPLLLLLALGVAAYGFYQRRAGWMGKALRVAAVVVAAVAVAYPIYTVAPVQAMSEKRGSLEVVEEACRMLGPRAAVVVLEESDRSLFDDLVPQTIRSFCGAEVAITRGHASTPDSLARLASEFGAEGRGLYVVAGEPEGIQHLLPNAQVMKTRLALDQQTIEQTLTRRPSGYMSEGFEIAVARVPPA